MVTVDAQNMQSDFAVNKYLHIFAICWISLSYRVTTHGITNIGECYLISVSIQMTRVFGYRSNVTNCTPANSAVVTYAANTPFLTILTVPLSLNYHF